MTKYFDDVMEAAFLAGVVYGMTLALKEPAGMTTVQAVEAERQQAYQVWRRKWSGLEEDRSVTPWRVWSAPEQCQAQFDDDHCEAPKDHPGQHVKGAFQWAGCPSRNEGHRCVLRQQHTGQHLDGFKDGFHSWTGMREVR